eukprot:403331100
MKKDLELKKKKKFQMMDAKQNEILQRTNKNKQHSHQFQEYLKMIEIQRTNESLIHDTKKLIKDKSNLSISFIQPQIKKFSLRETKRKQEEKQINDENKKMMMRILSKNPSVSTQKMHRDYEKHKAAKNLLSQYQHDEYFDKIYKKRKLSIAKLPPLNSEHKRGGYYQNKEDNIIDYQFYESSTQVNKSALNHYHSINDYEVGNAENLQDYNSYISPEQNYGSYTYINERSVKNLSQSPPPLIVIKQPISNQISAIQSKPKSPQVIQQVDAQNDYSVNSSRDLKQNGNKNQQELDNSFDAINDDQQVLGMIEINQNQNTFIDKNQKSSSHFEEQKQNLESKVLQENHQQDSHKLDQLLQQDSITISQKQNSLVSQIQSSKQSPAKLIDEDFYDIPDLNSADINLNILPSPSQSPQEKLKQLSDSTNKLDQQNQSVKLTKKISFSSPKNESIIKDQVNNSHQSMRQSVNQIDDVHMFEESNQEYQDDFE